MIRMKCRRIVHISRLKGIWMGAGCMGQLGKTQNATKNFSANAKMVRIFLLNISHFSIKN